MCGAYLAVCGDRLKKATRMEEFLIYFWDTRLGVTGFFSLSLSLFSSVSLFAFRFSFLSLSVPLFFCSFLVFFFWF